MTNELIHSENPQIRVQTSPTIYVGRNRTVSVNIICAQKICDIKVTIVKYKNDLL